MILILGINIRLIEIERPGIEGSIYRRSRGRRRGRRHQKIGWESCFNAGFAGMIKTGLTNFFRSVENTSK